MREKERKVRERFESGEPARKRQKVQAISASQDGDEEQYVLDEYQSEDGSSKKAKDHQDSEVALSSETVTLMQKLGLQIPKSASKEQTEDEELEELKIFFCSRTHSQLSQFVGELRRVKLPSAYPADDDQSKTTAYPDEEIKHVPLASRKNLCINDKVASLKHPTAINERCLELQEPKTPAEKRCKYLPTKQDEALNLDFRQYALARVRDIEDLGALGKRIGVCPYYAARSVIGPSEVCDDDQRPLRTKH